MQTYTYEQARELIKDGDIVFFKDKPNITSKIIGLVTHSHFSHVAIAFWITADCVTESKVKRLMIVEATGKTKRSIVNMSNDRKYNMVIITPPLSWREVSGDALDRVGLVPYGFTDGFYIGLRNITFRYTGVVLKTDNPAGEVCSEFVAKTYKLAQTQISPQELYDALLTQHKCDIKFELKPLI